MRVYHGSNGDIEAICLTQGSRYKDFGMGFYVTTNLETAQRMARKKTALFQGTPTVITYDFDESALVSKQLDVLVFPEKANPEWVRFIEGNRNRRYSSGQHGYDIVKGPIADDGVALQLDRLRAHADSVQAIADALQDVFLDQQICFCSPRSLNYLIKISSCRIR